MTIRSIPAVLIFILAACSHGPTRPSDSDVVLIPQWHLAPKTMTNPTSPQLPQTENQLAVYRRLETGIRDREFSTVVVEGCSGKIETGFPLSFNGWKLSDLEEKIRNRESIDEAMTNVGLKVAAKYPKLTHVVCGDDLALVDKHQLILSDLRGLAGFRMRMEQYKADAAKEADYLKSVREILKLPPKATAADARAALALRMREKIAEFREVLAERDRSFVKTIEQSEKPVAVVIGAIHISDLKKQLEEKSIRTKIESVSGMPGGEAELIDRFEELLGK
jgi:hypothetical protein